MPPTPVPSPKMMRYRRRRYGNGSYPTTLNPHQFYGPSPWDVPNRFSLTFNYQIPG